MVPAGIVQQTLDELVPLLAADDIIIDGGNSYYRDDIIRAKALKEHKIHYVDCGTSGGVWGLERGYCLMIGGEESVVTRLDPIFKTIAPASARPSRTRADQGGHRTREGYLHCGPNGAGHFVKMVHNGIEYGMMAAIGEGLSIIKHADAGKTAKPSTPRRRRCAIRSSTSTTSMSAEVAEVWRRGSGDRLLAGRPDGRRLCQVARPE